MGRRELIAIVVAFTPVACSLLTSTDDLNSYVEPGRPDGGTVDGDATTTTDGGALDGGTDGTTVDLDTGISPMTGDEYAAMVKGDGPIAYWRLGETSGSTAKDETGAYDGTWSGTPDLGVAGPFAGTSRAARLKGAERIVADALANRSSAWTGLTMEAWFSSELAPGAEGCITQFAGTDGQTVISMFRDDTSNAMKAHVGSYYPQGTTTIFDAAWHHVAVTVGGGSITLYVDAKAEATLGGTQAVPTAGYFVMGTDYDGLDAGFVTRAYFSGRLAEIAIYDKALSASTIATHRAARR